MNDGMRRITCGLVLLWGVWFLPACSKSGRADGYGGETNWLHCDVEADCAGGYRCEAHRCVAVDATSRDAGTRSAGGGGADASAARDDAGRILTGGSAGRGAGGAQETAGAGAGGSSGNPGQAGAAAGGQGGAFATTCQVASDCALVPLGCCPYCAVGTTDDFIAVANEAADAALAVQCPSGRMCSCASPPPYDPLQSVVRVDCIAQQCAVIDARKTQATACQNDSDCHLVPGGCCACGPDPRQWASFNGGDPYPQRPVCNIACAACAEPTTRPEAFCATDKHCAVREIPRVSGMPSSTCFSPTQNSDRAHDIGAVGCDCYTAGTAACVVDSSGSKSYLACPAPEMPWQVGTTCSTP